MAQTLCQLEKKGGSFGGSETSLWSNSNPTSNYGYATITLNQSIESFKYVKIKYYNNTASLVELSVLASVEDIKKTYVASGCNMATVEPYSNAYFVRAYGFISGTSVFIGNAIYVDSPSSATPSHLIPIGIYGVN